jgi:hypothetical protein
MESALYRAYVTCTGNERSMHFDRRISEQGSPCGI